MNPKLINAITTGEHPGSFTIRDGITEVIAYWKATVPMLHNAAGRCMPRWEDLEIKTGEWAASELFEESAAYADGNGGKAAHQFCTRCLVSRIPREVVTEIQVGDTTVELVTDASRVPGERLEDEARELADLEGVTLEEARAEMLGDSTASDDEVAAEIEKLTEKPVAKANTRTRVANRRPARKTVSRGTKVG